MNQFQSPLFKLPSEVRQLIWRYAFLGAPLHVGIENDHGLSPRDTLFGIRRVDLSLDGKPMDFAEYWNERNTLSDIWGALDLEECIRLPGRLSTYFRPGSIAG